MAENAAGRIFRVLFVCTGNICRSPFAQVLTRYLLDVHLPAAAARFEIASAGVGAVVGSPMHPASRAALEPWGLAGAAAEDFWASRRDGRRRRRRGRADGGWGRRGGGRARGRPPRRWRGGPRRCRRGGAGRCAAGPPERGRER
ncbi:MAG TPA: hypothetical protein VH134_12870 [Candidatus Dormibacteraeota bacterium]|nr:hypothetical protein [Candidatus Dormibacteraeota bacterium]